MAAVKLSIEVEGVKRMKTLMRVLAEPDLPYLDAALDEAGDVLGRAMASRAPSGIGRHVKAGRVKGSGSNKRVEVNIDHPAASSFEFGKNYGHHFQGNNSSGQKRRKRGAAAKKAARFKLASGKGFKAKPYIGVLASYGTGKPGALQDVTPKVQQILADGIEREITRIAKGPDR